MRIPNLPLVALSLLAAAPGIVSAVDYYRWRGPDLNGISPEKGWSIDWPAEGPKQLWKASIGIGFSTMAEAAGRTYAMGNANDQDTVWCFDAPTGKVLWKHTYACKLEPKYYEGGPSATPTVDGATVFTFSKLGDVFALDAAKGTVLWHTNVVAAFGVKLPTWFLASSPLVEGSLLLLNAGEAGLALDKQSGKLVWASGKEKPGGYSSGVPIGAGADRAAIFAVEKDYLAVRVSDGKVLWRQPWPTMYDVNAADAVLAGPGLFLASSGYNHGGALVRYTASDTKVVWENKNLRNQFNPSVFLNGHFYGFDGDSGRKETSLRCVDATTGEPKWTQPTGFGSLMAADGKLIALNEKGTLMIIEATPTSFKQIASAQVLGGKCWSTPVLSNGRIYCRNAKGDLVCLDVSGKK